jgi:hypothetical protein
MQVEQLFVETLIDIDQKLGGNPSEYQLLRVSGLLRQILLDKKNLLEPASAATALTAKFRVVKPGPLPIPPGVRSHLDSYYASMPPDAPRPFVGFGYRGDVLRGERQWPGDQVLDLAREDFLAHEIITSNGSDYTVENVLRVAANSLGGVHLSETNHDQRSEELRRYMEGSMLFGRSMPAAMIFEIATCTLRACYPLAQELAGRTRLQAKPG